MSAFNARRIARDGLEQSLKDAEVNAPGWGASARTYSLALIALRLDADGQRREDEERRAHERVRLGGTR